jgi:large subunit ribosomal protein L29
LGVAITMNKKMEEFHALPPEQLDIAYKEAVKQLFHLKIQSATERLETPSEIRKVKKDIARILTIKRQRELAAAKEQAQAAAGKQGA